MVLPSHLSSSPFGGRTSPNSRNSEIGSPIRRSFSGNPFSKPSIVANPRSLNPTTPANSPSDYPRRNSISRESLFTPTDNEEKENGKDSLKPVRHRSPTVGKSTKNFMSPTISAASKFAASPKKKILGDRNDQVRSSLSFSTSKISSINSLNQTSEASTALDSDTNLQSALTPISKPPKTVRFGGVEVISCSDDNSEVTMMADGTDTKPEIAPISKSCIEATPFETSKTLEPVNVEVISISTNDLDSSPAKSNMTEDVDCVNLDPSFKISPVSSPIEVASLDADPLMAAPYDPKTNYLSPRPQFLHYKPRRINQHELDGGLDELFSSTTVSESEFTEEIDSKDKPMESDEAGDNSQIEDIEEIVNVCEQIGAKKSSTLHFSRMFKISSLLLILFTACFSICVVNVYDPNILERARLLTMEDSTEIFEFARTNFVGLLGKLEVWRANTESFVSDVILNIRGRPLIYLNQTEFLLKDFNPIGQCDLISHLNQEDMMKETGFVSFEDHKEEEQESLHENEVMKESDINAELVERDAPNEEVQESLQEIEAVKETDINAELVERDAQNEEEQLFHEQESVQEIEAITDSEIKGEPVVRDPQNEEEEQSVHEIEDKASESRDIEESLQEIIEDTSNNSPTAELSEEEHIKEKQIEDQYEVTSSPNFKILHEIEQEPATLGKSEEEQTDSIQQSNTEFQYQSPLVSPPSDPQPDVETKNGENIDLIEVSTDDKNSRDLTQNTAVIISAILLGFTLIAGLVYTRKPVSIPSNAGEKNEQPMQEEKKTNKSPIVRAAEEGEEEPIDDDDRSCSYETSSFQYSSMREDEPETAKRSSEAQSHGHSHGRSKMRKVSVSRRESMASSSLDEGSVSISASPSYGSFTTYEKIPIKHGDDEIVTPVRRSSRIRKATQQ